MRRTESEIRDAVLREFKWDTRVDDENVALNVHAGIVALSGTVESCSTVSNGDLTLYGDVDFWSQREDAEKAVRNIQGVHKVINLIQVRAGTPAPNDIRESIANALERHGQREAEHVQIDVEGGRVVLSGAVHSWIERQSAVRAARLTPGVKTVVDHLTVEPYVT